MARITMRQRAEAIAALTPAQEEAIAHYFAAAYKLAVKQSISGPLGTKPLLLEALGGDFQDWVKLVRQRLGQ